MYVDTFSCVHVADLNIKIPVSLSNKPRMTHRNIRTRKILYHAEVTYGQTRYLYDTAAQKSSCE